MTLPMMIPILASTEWLRNSPNSPLWIVCILLPLAAALSMLLNDEEQRHKCIAFSLSLLLLALAALLLMEITDTSLNELTKRDNLLGFRRQNSRLRFLFSLWIVLGYILSRFLLRIFYQWRDENMEDEDADDN